MDKDNYINNLIIRHLNGTCSSSEIQEIHDWIKKDVQNKKQYLQIKDMWDSSLNVADRNHSQLLSFYKLLAEKNSNKKVSVWIRISAAAAILVLGLFLGFLSNKEAPNIIDSDRLITFSVPYGSKSSIELSDGTKVDLNSGSTLTYPANFSSENRSVTLNGEGYFNVESDHNHPFIVNTKNFNIHVTGTKFNVNCYDDSNLLTTTLIEGKITMEIGKNNINVSPGEQVEINQKTKKISIFNIDSQYTTAWKDGVFIFKEASFPDLIKQLERWYNVSINYNISSLDTLYYTGQFKNEETIWQVLDALKLTAPINYKRINLREFELTYKK